MADFSQLPEELIDLVIKRLPCVEDFVISGALCKSWRYAVSVNRKTQKLCFSPALMLTNDDTDAQNIRSFSSLSIKRKRKRDFTMELPDIHGRRCWGSPFGWMVTFGLDFQIQLINPFSGVRLSLPHQSTFPNKYRTDDEGPDLVRLFCPRRFVLSSNPSLAFAPKSTQNQFCIVIAISHPEGKLSFSKPGDEAWRAVETPLGWFEDAIYFDGLIYAIDGKGMLMVCDISAHHAKGTLIKAFPKHDLNIKHKVYLVEMSEELNLVARYFIYVDDGSSTRISQCHTQSFSVHKFDFSTNRWIEVFDLGGHALFVGNMSSFVISTNDFPDFKRNAIYYTDDQTMNFYGNFCDMSVYDFEKKTLEPFYTGTNVLSRFSRPTFIIPSL